MKTSWLNSGVYQIVNKTNGKRYVGSSVNLKKRIRLHFAELRKGMFIAMDICKARSTCTAKPHSRYRS